MSLPKIKVESPVLAPQTPQRTSSPTPEYEESSDGTLSEEEDIKEEEEDQDVKHSAIALHAMLAYPPHISHAYGSHYQGNYMFAPRMMQLPGYDPMSGVSSEQSLDQMVSSNGLHTNFENAFGPQQQMQQTASMSNLQQPATMSNMQSAPMSNLQQMQQLPSMPDMLQQQMQQTAPMSNSQQPVQTSNLQQMQQLSPMPNNQQMQHLSPIPHNQQQQMQKPAPMAKMQQTKHQSFSTASGFIDSPHEAMMKEVNSFTHNMTQLANTMNARMTKAEFERDCLRAALEQQQSQHGGSGNTNMQLTSTPQTAPEFGSRNSRFRDAADVRYSIPVTPTRPAPLDAQHYNSVPGKNSGFTPTTTTGGGGGGQVSSFGSKLTGLNKHKSEKTRARKDLQIKVPGQGPLGAAMAGLPTPMSKSGASAGFSAGLAPPSAYMRTPSTLLLPNPSPLTPGVIGPLCGGGPLRSSNIVNKRKIHNLEKFLPPANAVVPLLPLTDTEIVVYFFQSLVRPVVSLRLYSRNWGPAHIADTLNEHRIVQGGYLRNTASVKCTTAIKKGKERYGEVWSEQLGTVFSGADDLKATDLMHLDAEEAGSAVDFDVRALDLEIKKHPREGVAGGIFTRCVKYCVEHNAAYTLRNVHELAVSLRNGTEPVQPKEPEGIYVAGRDLLLEREKKRAAEMMQHGDEMEGVDGADAEDDNDDADAYAHTDIAEAE